MDKPMSNEQIDAYMKKLGELRDLNNQVKTTTLKVAEDREALNEDLRTRIEDPGSQTTAPASDVIEKLKRSGQNRSRKNSTMSTRSAKSKGKSDADVAKENSNAYTDLKKQFVKSDAIKALGDIDEFKPGRGANASKADLEIVTWYKKRDKEFKFTHNSLIKTVTNLERTLEAIMSFLDKERPGGGKITSSTWQPHRPKMNALEEIEARRLEERQAKNRERTYCELRLYNVPETAFHHDIKKTKAAEIAKALAKMNLYLPKDKAIRAEEIKDVKRLRVKNVSTPAEKRVENDPVCDVMIVCFHVKERAWYVDRKYQEDFEVLKANHTQSSDRPRKEIQRSKSAKQRAAEKLAFEKMKMKNAQLLKDKFVDDEKFLEKIYVVKWTDGEPEAVPVTNRNWVHFVDNEVFKKDKRRINKMREIWRMEDKERINKAKDELKAIREAEKAADNVSNEHANPDDNLPEPRTEPQGEFVHSQDDTDEERSSDDSPNSFASASNTSFARYGTVGTNGDV